MENKIINKTLNIIIFLIPILIIPYKLEIAPYNILKYIALIICGIILLVLLILKRKELKFDLIDKTLIAFYTLICISTIFSTKILVSIFGFENRYEGLITFTIYFLTYYCAKYFYKYNEKIKKYAILTISITCVIGILQYYNIFPLYYIFNIPFNSSFASSTFGNRNFFGSFLSMVTPIMIALYLIKKNKIYLVLSYLSFFALLTSMTRSAWVAFGIVCIFGIIYIIKNRNKEIVKRTIFIIIGFIIIFVFVLIPPPFLNKRLPQNANSLLGDRLALMNNELLNVIEDNKLDRNLGSNRIRIWTMTLKAIAQTPLLGSGPDTLYYSLLHNCTLDALSYYDDFNAIPDKAHNEYLNIAGTLGIPALIIYLAFLAQIFGKTKQIYKNNANFIFVLPIISYLIQAFFNISTIGVTPIFWFLLGLIQNDEFKNNLFPMQ